MDKNELYKTRLGIMSLTPGLTSEQVEEIVKLVEEARKNRIPIKRNRENNNEK